MTTDIEINFEKRLINELSQTTSVDLKKENARIHEELEKTQNTVLVLKESLINLEKLYFEVCNELRQYKDKEVL